jgi:hypothetical protein
MAIITVYGGNALYAVRHRETRRLVLVAPAFGFARRWDAAEGRD